MNILKFITKRTLFALGLILASPLIILTWIEGLIFGRKAEWIYGSCKEIVSICPTVIGEYIRLAFYWAVCAHVSIEARLLFGSMIAHRATIIRDGTVIGAYTILGYAELGENVLVAPRVSVISGKYQHGKPGERAASGSVTEHYERITIGRNSWIGQEAIVMANIGENCTVAAGSVVYRPVSDGATVMGNPAKKVSIDITVEKPERFSV